MAETPRLDYRRSARWMEGNAERVGDQLACPFCDEGECRFCRPMDGHDCFSCEFTRRCVQCEGAREVLVSGRDGDWSFYQPLGWGGGDEGA